MGILDSIMSMIGGGGSQAGSSSMGNIVGGLLGGGQGAAGATGGATGGMAGGLGGLVSQFENAGLGHVIQSWMGNGPNQSISPQQLGGVLGQDQVNSMSQQAGMNSGDFLSQLAQHLPGAVDQATPGGVGTPGAGGSVAV